MNPTGTMPYFFAAVSSFLRARSRAGFVLERHLLEAGEGVADVRGIVDREPSLPLRVDVREGAVGQVSAVGRVELRHVGKSTTRGAPHRT